MDDILQTAPALLEATLARWQLLVATLPAALLIRPRAPGEWSALHCLQHMLDFDELVFPARVAAFRAGTEMADFEPDEHGRPLPAGVAPAEVLAAFTPWRTNTIRTIRGLTPGELALATRHAALGPATLGEFVHETVGHDLMHLMQAERALQRPFADAAGPWRRYFD